MSLIHHPIYLDILTFSSLKARTHCVFSSSLILCYLKDVQSLEAEERVDCNTNSYKGRHSLKRRYILCKINIVFVRKSIVCIFYRMVSTYKGLLCREAVSKQLYITFLLSVSVSILFLYININHPLVTISSLQSAQVSLYIGSGTIYQSNILLWNQSSTSPILMIFSKIWHVITHCLKVVRTSSLMILDQFWNWKEAIS